MTDRLGHPHPLRKWFVAIVFMWMAIAALLWGRLAQDALPFIVAGDLVHDHPDQIYGGNSGYLFDLHPMFSEHLCRAAPTGTTCDKIETGYVSMPLGLPFAVVVSTAGPDYGVLLTRLLAAGSLATGMLVLWKRLAGRSREAPRYLVATALLLTPMAVVPITLGQTSPYLFLVACLGVRRTDRRGPAVMVAAGWALTIALKVFPVGLGVVLLWQRRVRLLIMTILALVVLAALSMAIAPVSIWADFVHTTSRLATRSLGNPYNGSLDNAAAAIWHPIVEGAAAQRLLASARVALGGGLWWWGVRDADDDAQWAFGWLVLLFAVPLVWWHYLWLAVAALGIVLAGRGVDRKWIMALPVMAVATIPMSLANSNGGSFVIAQGLFLLLSAIGVGAIARTTRPARQN